MSICLFHQIPFNDPSAQRLYHAAMPLSSFKTMLDYARAHDIDISGFEDVSVDKLDSLLPQITHELDVRALMDIKDAATICHPTQFGEDNLFRQLPPEMRAVRAWGRSISSKLSHHLKLV